jgi:hypothetical protein
MKLITNFFTTALLLAVFNTAFAADGRKEAVLDMGKGAFTLTFSVPSEAEGPYDFGTNPGIGGNMKGDFQHQEVMFRGMIDASSAGFYKATTQKISPNKKGDKLTPDNMAKKQISSHGFKDKAVQINCPSTKIEGANSICYKMSGEPIFDGGPTSFRAAAVVIAVSWANDTQGYTLMGMVTEDNVEKFNSNRSDIEKYASKLLSFVFKNHNVVKN